MRLGFAVRRDLVSLWHGQRNLAMPDRDHFRAWLMTGHAPLDRHDLSLTHLNGWIAVGFHDGPPLWLSPADTVRLRSIL
jgi:hypothetical protein